MAGPGIFDVADSSSFSIVEVLPVIYICRGMRHMYGGQISPEMYQLATSFHLGKPTVKFETLPRTVWNFRFSLYTLYTAVLVIWLGLFALLSYLLEFSRNMADIPSNYAPVFVIFWPVIWMMAIRCIIGYDILRSINIPVSISALQACSVITSMIGA